MKLRTNGLNIILLILAQSCPYYATNKKMLKQDAVVICLQMKSYGFLGTNSTTAYALAKTMIHTLQYL